MNKKLTPTQLKQRRNIRYGAIVLSGWVAYVYFATIMKLKPESFNDVVVPDEYRKKKLEKNTKIENVDKKNQEKIV